MTVLMAAEDSVTHATYTWSAADADAGAGYTGPNSPVNVRVASGKTEAQKFAGLPFSRARQKNTYEYGTKGDFNTDDSSAFNAAMAAVSVAPGGLVLHSGVSSISAHYVLPGFAGDAPSPTMPLVHVKGDGWTAISLPSPGDNSTWSSQRHHKGSVIRQTSIGGGTLFSYGTSLVFAQGLQITDTALLGPSVAGEHGVSFANATLQMGLIKHVLLAGWDTGLTLGNIEETYFEQITIAGCNTGLVDGVGSAATTCGFRDVFVTLNGTGIKVIQGGWWTISGGCIQANDVGLALVPSSATEINSCGAPKIEGIWFEGNKYADVRIDGRDTGINAISNLIIDHCRSSDGYFEHLGGGIVQYMAIRDTYAPNWFIFLDRFALNCTIEDPSTLAGTLDYGVGTVFLRPQPKWAVVYIDANKNVTGETPVTALDNFQIASSISWTVTGYNCGIISVPGLGGGCRVFGPGSGALISTTNVSNLNTDLQVADAPWACGFQGLFPGVPATVGTIFEIVNTDGSVPIRIESVRIGTGSHFKIRVSRILGGTTKYIEYGDYDTTTGYNPPQALNLHFAFTRGVLYIIDGATDTVVMSGDGSIPGLTAAQVSINMGYEAANIMPIRFWFDTKAEYAGLTNVPGRDQLAVHAARAMGRLWNQMGYTLL